MKLANGRQPGGKRRKQRASRRRVRLAPAFLALVALGTLAPSCPPLLPVLLASLPTDGATGVSRSAWFTLTFSDDVPAASKNLMMVVCNGVPRFVRTHLLAPDTLVVNPPGTLPADADCVLGFSTVAGPQLVNFQTAPAAAPFATIHDRTDRNAPLPFPDDFFLVEDPTTPTGFRPDVIVPDRSSAVEGLLSAMAATVASLDGFSPIGNFGVQLSGPPDPATLPLDQEASLDPLATVGLFDLSPASATFGERVPFKLTIRSDRIGSQPLSHSLVIFPAIPLTPTGVYGLVVTNRVLDGNGEPLAPSGFFQAVMGDPAPGEHAAVTRARPLANEVLDAVEGIGPVPIPREDVALAVRVTVRSTDDIPTDVLALREDVFAQPVSFTIDIVTPRSGNVAAIAHGTFEVPRWREGAFFVRDAGGRPIQVGTNTLDFILALPLAAATQGRAPITMYQHGNPGSAENEVPGAARGYLADAGFAVGGFTDVLNRDFNSVNEQVLGVFGALLVTGEVPDFYLQTYAEQIAFVRVLKAMGSVDVLPLGAPDGVPDLDPSVLTYEGISYGSNHGQAFLAYAPEIEAAGLVVGAVRLAELVEYQDRTQPTGEPRLLIEQLPPFLPGVTPPDFWMGLSLFAMVYDRQDPHNHAAFLYANPIEIAGTTERSSILVFEGISDSYTKNNSTRSLASQLGPIPHLAPVIVPVSYLPVQASPIQGNVSADTTAAFVQFAPDGIPGIPPSSGCVGESEGHFCAQTAPEARRLRTDFYRSAVDLAVPIVSR